MARQWRIEYPGAVYHVLSRGNGRQEIFRSNDDRNLFLDLVRALTERYAIKVHAYVLMDNHYHLLLQTNDANLSRAMQWFGTSYTRKFHWAHNTGGHLFQGRFKSIIVGNDAYLLRLSCYIHRNPLRAGIVGRLADYPWSSYPFYAYSRKAPAWLTTQTILNQLAGGDPRKAYRKKVQRYSDEQNNLMKDIKHGFIYGSQDFVLDLKTRFLGDTKKAELPQHNQLMRVVDPQRLLNKASSILEFDLASARIAKKIAPGEKEKRDMLIYLLWKTGRLSNKEIGAFLGVTYSTISKVVSAFSARVQVDENLLDKFDQLNSRCRV